MENIEQGVLHRSIEDIGDFLQSVFYNRLDPMTMFQYSDFLYIHILMVSDKISPCQSDAHDGDKSFDSVNLGHVCVLYVETEGFHGLEKGLDLPPLLVSDYSTFGTVIADENLKLGFSGGVPEPDACKIHIFSLHKIKFMVEKTPRRV